MNATIILHRLRVFLLSIAALLCVGTVLELWLTEHTESAVQLIPFGLCGLGLLAIGAALLRPQRATLLILRLSMGLMAVGSAFGIFEHIEHNLAFELEIRPTATANQVQRRVVSISISRDARLRIHDQAAAGFCRFHYSEQQSH
jgi:hypothetical protein